ncbi:MAG: hypothetical protein LUD15_07190 [Bacteroides sp.]|nr:hypothetical protein [Bacteroides sp.]
MTDLVENAFRMAVLGDKIYVICVEYDNWTPWPGYVLLNGESEEILDTAFLKVDDLPVNPCGITVDPVTGEIWIGSHASATSYEDRGYVYRFAANGNLLNKYAVGIGPSAFAFIR